MRLQRLLVAFVSVALLGLPTLVLSAGPASAAFTTTVSLEGCATYPDTQCYGLPAAPQVYNRPLTFSGQLAYDPGTGVQGLAGQTVSLQRAPKGSTAFVEVGTAVTDGGGFYSLGTPAVFNAVYRVVYPGTVEYTSATSAPVAAKALRDFQAKQKKLANGKFKFWGKLTPKYANKTIRLQRLEGKVWKTLRTTKTSKKSRWSFIVEGKATQGSVSYRAIIGGDKRFKKNWITYTITTQ